MKTDQYKKDLEKALQELAIAFVYMCKNSTGFNGNPVEFSSGLAQEAVTKAIVEVGRQ